MNRLRTQRFASLVITFFENGGEVALYVKESLPYPTLKLKSEKLEFLSVEISPPQIKSFLVVCWYHPSTSGVDEESFENLRDTLKQLDKGGEITYIDW